MKLDVSILLAVLFSVHVNCASISTRNSEELSVTKFLETFGYLNKTNSTGRTDVAPNPEDAENAIIAFQKFVGLNVTGRIDEETKRKMLSPRCGVPDISSNDPNTPVSYNVPGFKWRKSSLTWKILQFSQTSRLTRDQQRNSMRKALKFWSDKTPLEFHEIDSSSQQKADIEIKFSRGDHGDGYGNRFDGRGRTLAHAFFPENGDTHFDDDEEWTIHGSRGTDLEIVAAHEFGHALGLGHSNVPKSLMAPYYQGYIPNFSLHWDDVRGIQSLYGKNTKPDTSRQPENTPTKKTPSGEPVYCTWKRIDAAMSFEEKEFIFQSNEVLTINGSTKRIQLISELFPNAPASVDAAVTVDDHYFRKTLLFKGDKVWRYSRRSPSGFELDDGFPKAFRKGSKRSPDAAVVYKMYTSSTSTIYLFEGFYFRRFDHLYNQYQGRYFSIRRYWRRIPPKVDAAMALRDVTLFFKHNRVYTLNNFYRAVIDRKSVSISEWLGCQ